MVARHSMLALGLVCMIAGVAAALLFGRNQVAVPPPGTGAPAAVNDGALVAELREISTRVASLQDQVAALRTPLDRQPAPLPQDPQPAPSEDVERLVARLSKLADRLDGPMSDRAHEALRQARVARPQPDLVAVEALQRQLHDGAGISTEAMLTVQRDWLLLGMDDVVQLLGVPSEIIAQGHGGLYWSYCGRDGGEILNVVFRDGLVVAVRE